MGVCGVLIQILWGPTTALYVEVDLSRSLLAQAMRDYRGVLFYLAPQSGPMASWEDLLGQVPSVSARNGCIPFPSSTS